MDLKGIKCYECASNSLAKDENCETGVSRSAPKSCPATAKFCDYVKLKVETGLGGNYSKTYTSDVELWD